MQNIKKVLLIHIRTRGLQMIQAACRGHSGHLGMNMHIRSGIITLLTVAAVAGCTYNNGQPNPPATGVLLGGVTGAAVGNALGGSVRATVIGGAIGAAVGGSIAANMAAQERELNQSLAGTGALITNSGTQLRVILPEDVTFPTGSATVNSAFRPALRSMAQNLVLYPNSSVRIIGHTDNVGSAAYNQQLSLDRALSVSRILIGYGVQSFRVTYGGHGFDEPIASNVTAMGRAQNRRVEIIITPTN